MKVTPYKNIIQKYNEAKINAQRGLEKNADPAGKVMACDDKSMNREADIKISEDYQIHEKSMKELIAMDQNEARLKELSEKIASGNYKIASHEIAKSIIDKCQ